jgi:hypothetical protein
MRTQSCRNTSRIMLRVKRMLNPDINIPRDEANAKKDDADIDWMFLFTVLSQPESYSGVRLWHRQKPSANCR